MATEAAIYLLKAEESLAGAESEFANGRYNNCANRCYYSCFQAAVYALATSGISPTGAQRGWGHTFVQAQFAGQLVSRRQLYPSGLRDVLTRTLILRHKADYSEDQVTQTQASRALRRCRELVEAIQAKASESL